MAEIEIKNLRKAAKRILKAVKDKEKIIIYGDSDLDGTASVIILQEALKNLGADSFEVYPHTKRRLFRFAGQIGGANLRYGVGVYFPDRENEGYGINEKALFFLKKFTPCLLISVDLGIGNWREVEIGKKLGFEIIIIDHHEILEKLPKAKIIVDPKQKGDKYPFKQFAAAGLVFKLTEILFQNNFSESLRKNFLELAAMATIADMMPKTDDNLMIISEGLNYLKTSWRPGIQALFEIEEFKSFDLTQKVSKMNSLLNIRDVENGLPASFRLLTASSKKEAQALAKKLYEKGKERKEKIQELLKEIEKRVGQKMEPIIFEGSNDWDWEIALLGIIASIASHKYKKPVFLYSKGKSESLGSIRAPKDFNVVEAMKSFSKKLIAYGGHPQAAGFRVSNNNLKEFREYLIKYFNNLNVD